jgi:ferritin
MISEKILNALNEQINEELFSAYLYMAMSAYLKSINLNGSAKWMEMQVQEELLHAKKMYDFVYDRGGQVVFKQIAKPKGNWNSLLNVFEEAYAHEQHITKKINNLFKLSIEENDYATNSFLQWFITEQVEEEANVDEIVQQLKLIGDNKSALFMFDRELGGRNLPAATE